MNNNNSDVQPQKLVVALFAFLSGVSAVSAAVLPAVHF
jgi:hypothetical protein